MFFKSCCFAVVSWHRRADLWCHVTVLGERASTAVSRDVARCPARACTVLWCWLHVALERALLHVALHTGRCCGGAVLPQCAVRRGMHSSALWSQPVWHCTICCCDALQVHCGGLTVWCELSVDSTLFIVHKVQCNLATLHRSSRRPHHAHHIHRGHPTCLRRRCQVSSGESVRVASRKP